jgi:1-acyl-sn-glycerol-3-phosphate acyltransferase
MGRFCLFLGIVVLCLLDDLFFIELRGKSKDYRARALWLQKWVRRLLSCLNIHHECLGHPPANGILASNHLSYLDIPILAAQTPIVFLAKKEVRNWPLIGWCTRCAGTLFIDREKKSDVKRLASQFEPVLNTGVLLGLFLEGTSTDGHQVLPFRSSLLEPAQAHHWPATAVRVGYKIDDGSVENEVCYWGDMTFFPHLLNLLSKREIHALVIYGSTQPPGLDRKEMARALHSQVSALNTEAFQSI